MYIYIYIPSGLNIYSPLLMGKTDYFYGHQVIPKIKKVHLLAPVEHPLLIPLAGCPDSSSSPTTHSCDRCFARSRKTP